MARLKVQSKTPQEAAPGPDLWAGVSSIDDVLEAPRPAGEAELAVWLARRTAINGVVYMTRFDPRAVLTLSTDEYDTWELERRRWLTSVLLERKTT
jgi:hypothetical protein